MPVTAEQGRVRDEKENLSLEGLKKNSTHGNHETITLFREIIQSEGIRSQAFWKFKYANA